MGVLSPSGRLNRFFYRVGRGAPFISQSDPVQASEWILRKVPSGDAHYYDATLDRSLQRLAFRPNKSDTTGISLFREMFVPPRTLAFTGRKPPYHVFRLRAGDVTALGIHLCVELDDKIPGHIVLGGVAYIDKPTREQKQQQERLQWALADLAIPAYIVQRSL